MGTILAVLLQATVAFTTVARGTDSQITEPRQAVARSADEWQALWSAHSPERAPTVDFARFMVVGVFLGTRPTSGYTVEIIRVQSRDGVTTVDYREQPPAADSFNLQVLTTPFHMVRIPRTDKVEFRKIGS